MAYLRIVDTMQRTTDEVVLRKPINAIGRREGNDVVLGDPTIAATHANLVMSGAFATLWIAGTVEASVSWRKDHRLRREAWEAKHAQSSLTLTPTSVGWELRF